MNTRWPVVDRSFFPQTNCGAVRGRLHRVIQLGAAWLGGGKGGQAPGKHAFGPIWQPLLRSLPVLESCAAPGWTRLATGQIGVWIGPAGRIPGSVGVGAEHVAGNESGRSIEITSVPDAIKGYGHVRIKECGAARLTLATASATGLNTAEVVEVLGPSPDCPCALLRSMPAARLGYGLWLHCVHNKWRGCFALLLAPLRFPAKPLWRN